jgi:hypothetical protein
VDFAKMHGALKVAVNGDEAKFGELAFDMRSLLKARATHVDYDEKATRIMEDWKLDWAWMKPWLDRFDQACRSGSDERLAEWLANGAPAVTEQSKPAVA